LAGTGAPVPAGSGGYAHIDRGSAAVPSAAPAGYTVSGVDVSAYQQGVDWPAAAAGGATNFAASRMSIAGMDDGSSQVAVGNDGLLYHTQRHPGGTWTGWSRLPGANGWPVFAASAVFIANTTGGTAQVVAIGNNGLINQNTRTADGSWHGWTKVTTTKARDIAAVGRWNSTLQLIQIAQ
jgi:hypothetical protein